MSMIGGAADEFGGLLRALGQELRELGLDSARSRQCMIAALSVALSVTLAQWLHFDEVWWAAISGFISTQATRPASIRRGLLRIVGTAAGAGLALVMVPWLAYDHVACCLMLMVFAGVGILGSMVSPHGYAWLFAGITANLVLLMSLDNPLSALGFAWYRTMEVVVGTLAAVLFAIMLAPDAPAGPPVAAPPGWSDLLGDRWPAVLHALRSGIAVALMPVVWSWFAVPSLAQMAVTAAAVMAIPVLSGNPSQDAGLIIRRAVYRLAGCLFGGVVGLACLALSLTDYLPWMVLLMAGVWVGTHLQASERGIGYAGTQATVVFIMTLVQGWGPPESILPGIDRFIGITLGLATLLAVSMLLLLPYGSDSPDQAIGNP